MTPRWRWHLFSFSLWLALKTRWQWAYDLMGWCVLPEWHSDGADCGEGVPF